MFCFKLVCSIFVLNDFCQVKFLIAPQIRVSEGQRSIDRSNYLHFLRVQSSVTYFHANNARFLENMKLNMHSKVHVRVRFHHYSRFAIVTGGQGERDECLSRRVLRRCGTFETALPSVFHSPDRLAAACGPLRSRRIPIFVFRYLLEPI